MGIEGVFQELPFLDLLGIEVTVAEDGHAEGRLEMRRELSSNPGKTIAHGGVTFALADTVGGAAIVSEALAPTPTIDMRVDYLRPATKDLYAEGDVVRHGRTSAVVDVSVWDEADDEIALVRGIYRTADFEDSSPHDWKPGDADESM